MSLPYLHPFLGLSNGLNTLHAAGGGGGGIGGWVELGRTTLGSANSNITVSSLADKRYYMLLVNTLGKSGADNNHSRFNSDSGTNYARRLSENGGADGTGTSIDHMLHSLVSPSTPTFDVGFIANRSTSEKLMLGHSVYQNTAGAGTAPSRAEYVNKYAQTSNPITTFSLTTLSATTFNTGSEVVVLGWDPADTHTNNFWQELTDVSWTSGDTIDTGTFTAKKYLWVQSWTTQSTSHSSKVLFNNDSGTNYAFRVQEDGFGDWTVTNGAYGLFPLVAQGSSDVYPQTFSNYFIINNSANEKLIIGHNIHLYASGPGNRRHEVVAKWTNTSSQITSIKYSNINGNAFSGGQIKVWGSD